MTEIWAAIAGAFVGGGLALGAAEWSFWRVRKAQADAERLAEIALLQGLLEELGVVERIASERSATPLPLDFYRQVLPLGVRIPASNRSALAEYGEAAIRYCGRVNRLVSFGAAKRSRGEDPGAEKISSKHVEPVLESAQKLKSIISDVIGRM